MNFLKQTFTVAILFAALQTAYCQPICAFDKLHTNLLAQDASFRKSMLSNEIKILEYIRKHPAISLNTLRGSSINTALYTIPVVVHVVHTGGAIGTIYNPSDAQVTGAINYLNQVYNGSYPGTEGVGDLQVQFVLASRDTNCNASTGIDRINGSALPNYTTYGVNSGATGSGVHDTIVKNFDRWDPNSYYNIWVVNKIDGKDGTSGQFIAGYAYFAGASALIDGTVMLATQMAAGQKTLPHEIGHALSLYHPFQGSSDAATCPANADCNTDGDRVCDTDPITYNQTAGVVDFTCRSSSTTNTCTGTPYSINTEHNYMNYTSCYTLFTAGQKARMQAAMSLPSRQSLVNSLAAGTYPVSPYVAPVNGSCTPVTSATGLSSHAAGIMNVSIANRSFYSGDSPNDGGYVDKTIKCLNLIQLQKNSTYNFSITIYGQNYEQLGIWIDYNNDGVFNNTTEQVYFNSSITPLYAGTNYTTVSGSFTVPGTAAATTLRMRVMDEVSTAYGAGYAVTGACYNPVYGQAEDYPVYLTALLPVHLDYFNGVKNNKDALLTWKTSAEENAKEFQVEKSTDGIAFDLIGTVPAANLASGSIYSFTDKGITADKNYYRLRQIDKDEKTALSQVILIKALNIRDQKLDVITNPFTNQIDIVFNNMPGGTGTINLFDATGRKVYSRNHPVTAGEPIHINLSGYRLLPGMYILQAQIGNEVMMEKLIKQ